jgi:hypothetical protein
LADPNREVDRRKKRKEKWIVDEQKTDRRASEVNGIISAVENR